MVGFVIILDFLHSFSKAFFCPLQLITYHASTSSFRLISILFNFNRFACTILQGMSVYVNNELGIVRYIGRIQFADGVWLGIELRKPGMYMYVYNSIVQCIYMYIIQ